jgi:pimeloyl-ACP methyl ester carboxylesterase
MPVDRIVAVNGLGLHYLDHGTEGKPPLVCIHGLTGNAHNFDALAPHLTSRYHVRALDVRGRGDSQWGPASGYAPQTYLSDLAGLLAALEVGRVTLIGTSMGGIISMLFASGYPERVERLVLNDIGPEIDPRGLERIGRYVGTAPEQFDDLEAVAAYYLETYPPARNFSREGLLEFARWAVKPAPGGKRTWKMDPQIRRPMRSGQAARPIDLWMPFGRITAPILAVRGAESDVLAARTLELMKTVARGLKSVEVAKVGHAPSLSEPEALAAIKEFLGV